MWNQRGCYKFLSLAHGTAMRAPSILWENKRSSTCHPEENHCEFPNKFPWTQQFGLDRFTDGTAKQWWKYQGFVTFVATSLYSSNSHIGHNYGPICMLYDWNELFCLENMLFHRWEPSNPFHPSPAQNTDNSANHWLDFFYDRNHFGTQLLNHGL